MAFTVKDVYDDVRRILGACGEAQLFRQVTLAVETLANTGEFDPLLGYADLCVNDGVVTLPREVYTLLAVNIGGNPAIGRDFLYRFHLNGLGDCKKSCRYQWEDKGLVPTLAEFSGSAKLVAFVERPEDAGKELWAYGTNQVGAWIKTLEQGVWKDGYRVPTVFGFQLPDAGAPVFTRITRVRKAETIGQVQLSSFDISDTTGTLLGAYDGDETEPSYRRIRLTDLSSSGWVRIAYRRRIYAVRSTNDLIPLPAQMPLLMMLRALKAYDEKDLANATGFEATARRLLGEAQFIQAPPVDSPVQVNDHVAIGNDTDSAWVD